MGHARCEELMGFNMGLASVCVCVCVREGRRRGKGGKKKDAGRADTFCGEENGNVLS
jgi:hypothetical protein